MMNYGDVERIRQRLGMNKMRFRGCLGVSRTRYWRWKHIGVEGSVQQLLKVIEAKPDVVEILEGDQQ